MNFGNLGIAAGAGVDEYRRSQEQDRRDAELKLQQQHAERQATQFSWDQLDQNEKVRIRDEGKKITDEYAPHFKAIAGGDLSSVTPFLVKAYNSQTGGHGDGNTVAMQTDAQGRQVGNFLNADGKVVHSQVITPEFANNALMASQVARLSSITPGAAVQQYNSDRKFGLEADKIAVDREGNQTKDKYYTGSLAQGTAELAQRMEIAKMNDARMRQQIGASQSSSLKDPAAYQAGVQEFNNYQQEYNDAVATGGKTAEVAVRKANAIQVKIANAAGRPLQLGLGGAGNSGKPVFDPSKVVWKEDAKTGEKLPYTMTEQGLVEVPVVGGPGGTPKIVARKGPDEARFTPVPSKSDITRPAAGVEYVQHPITGEMVPRSDLERGLGGKGSSMFNKLIGR